MSDAESVVVELVCMVEGDQRDTGGLYQLSHSVTPMINSILVGEASMIQLSFYIQTHLLTCNAENKMTLIFVSIVRVNVCCC